MSLADWTKLTGADPELTVLRASNETILPISYGAGSQYLISTVPSVGGKRAVGWLNNRIGLLDGPYEVSALMRLSAAANGCSVGLVTQWGGDDLEQTDGFALVLSMADGNASFSLQRGPGDGTVLMDPQDATANVWLHLLLQVRYDRAGNQVLQVAANNVAVHGVQSPVWIGEDPITIKRYQIARGSGYTGFVMRSGDQASKLYLGYINITSTLSSL